jgi:hypothetical protein
VRTPQEAVTTFLAAGLDVLVMEDLIVTRADDSPSASAGTSPRR